MSKRFDSGGASVEEGPAVGGGANDDAGPGLGVVIGAWAVGAGVELIATGGGATGVGVSTIGTIGDAVGAGMAVETGSGGVGAVDAGSPQANASASAAGAR